MKIDIISIAKKESTIYDPLYKELIKMSSKFAKIEDIELFPKTVAKAHKLDSSSSQKSYTQVLEPYLNRGYSIALHPDGKKIDSFEFSKLLLDKMSLQFFIGGAYGFEDLFINKCNKVISLSELTMSHKIAKAVLFEQIYRGFSINSNHPYHK
ncbi:MAG: 23S rRNA (pseudouridine(1915)-N(3))-methyltransferase RlmH [Campylobacterota bacterium]|nr:23S rRNA (pseudouridine(1915)-N(3))-methyltransferase RlmH [Campylobacterota bacterium]